MGTLCRAGFFLEGKISVKRRKNKKLEGKNSVKRRKKEKKIEK